MIPALILSRGRSVGFPGKDTYPVLGRPLMEYALLVAMHTPEIDREDYTHKLLEHFSFVPLSDCIIGADFEGKRSKTDMIRLCMDQTRITRSSHCLMVGDTTGDMMATQEVGVFFLGVTYGFGFKKGIVPDPKMADSCQDIFIFFML